MNEGRKIYIWGGRVRHTAPQREEQQHWEKGLAFTLTELATFAAENQAAGMEKAANMAECYDNGTYQGERIAYHIRLSFNVDKLHQIQDIDNPSPLEERDKRVRREALEEAAKLKCRYCKEGLRLSDHGGRTVHIHGTQILGCEASDIRSLIEREGE